LVNNQFQFLGHALYIGNQEIFTS